METIQTIRVSSLQDGQNQVRWKVPSEALAVRPYHGCEVTVVDSVVAELALLKQHADVYVSGRVNFRAHLVCADCGIEFDRDFSEPLSTEFLKGSAPAQSLPKVHELTGGEMERSLYEGDEIDLLPLIRDTILLAVPIAPFCQPDCKGICSECGGNLNVGECKCSSGVAS
jgi:uncharacterized protein